MVSQGLALLGQLIRDKKITLTKQLKEYALDQLEFWKVNLLHEFSELLEIPIPRHYVYMRAQ